jgi:hypothetical protein
MFEVGERVVCVDNRPNRRRKASGDFFYPSPLRKGRVYTVLAVQKSGTERRCKYSDSGWVVLSGDHISVGEQCWHGHDYHGAVRFRKLRNLDTSQSLQALIDLPNKVKNGELVDG